MTQVTQRFTNRVRDYIRYRPNYPPQILDTLRTQCRLTPTAIVADIGSGTGISAQIFLDNGNTVHGIEPNAAMRTAAESQLAAYPNFQSHDATAEATTLPANSIDLIVAGQAFHWFDRAPTRTEFSRILNPNGWVALLWNERLTTTTPFLAAYEQLLIDYGTDYTQVNHVQINDPVIKTFFHPHHVNKQTFPNRQTFAFAGLKGRLLSSSYTPTPDHPNYKPMLTHLKHLFNTHQTDGVIHLHYTTKLYYGHLTDA